MLSRYRERLGLLVGGLLFCALLWVSTLFIWSVDVSGTELLSKEQIRKELSGMGVKVGARISEVDRSAVLNTFLSEHPEISWAALNFKGTSAGLILKETESKPDTDEGGAARLLVASESGVIRGITVYEGVATVRPGTVVSEGDVLISGLISGSGGQMTEVPPLRVTEARGSVTAEVTRKISVSVPLSEELSRIERTEEKIKVISVFGREILLGSTEGLIFTGERNVTFFGVIEIPITVKTFSRQITVTDTVSRDGTEARLEAERRLYGKIAELLGSGELTYVRAEYTETENGIFALAEIGCTVEIAVPYKGTLKAE